MKPVFWMGSSREDLRDFPREARREIGYQLEHVQEDVDPNDWAHVYCGTRGARDSRQGIVGNFPHLSGDTAGGNLCLALLPKEDQEDEPAGFGLRSEAI